MKQLFALVMLLAALTARADEAQDAGPAVEVETVVVTGTRTPESSQRSTVKTDVITRDEAVRRGATNVAEALATQPGVQVNPGAYGYLGKISPIQIQGFDLNRVLILEDGEPVIGDVGGAIDLSAIPMTDIERIEVVTGPTSALYGSSAIGGVVNLITAPPPMGPSARTLAEYRSFNGLNLQGVAGDRTEKAWFAVDLGLTRQDGIALDPTLPDLQIPANTRTVLGLRAGVSLGSLVDFQVRLRWLHQTIDGLESTVFPGLGRYLTDLPTSTNRFALHAMATVHLPRGATLRFSLAGQEADSAETNRLRGSPDSQTQRSLEFLPSFEAIATVPDGKRTWVAGARVEARRLSQQLDQTETVGGTQMMTSLSEVDASWLPSAAVYAQLQWKLGPLTILPGARAEYHAGYGAVVAPRLALALTPVEPLILRASAGRGFRTPSPEELGFNFDHSIYGYKVIGNPNLTPESSWGVNGDVTWRPDAHWQLRVAGYGNWVDNLIDIDLAHGMTSGSVVSYTYANYEKVRTFGAQASVAYRIADWLRVDATYDYLWTHDDVNNVPLAARPEHTVTLSARAQLPYDFELYGRVHVVSDAYVDDTTRTPAYETVDLRVARELWPRSQVYAGVLNLFDEHQQPGRVGDLRPPIGRVFYAGFRAALPWEEQ